MPPSGALIFKLEQTFFQANPDYAEVQQLIRKEMRPGEVLPNQSLASALLVLRKRMGKKAYEALRSKAERAAERLETRTLAGVKRHPGVVKTLEQVRDSGWWVVAASDMGKKPVAGFLEANSLSQYVNLVVARSRLDQEQLLAVRLRPVQTRLKSLANSVYFCNSSRDVKEAKALGMKCFVLPSAVEPFRTLYLAGPSGIILSLEEIPPLLSLPSMKLPELPKTESKKLSPLSRRRPPRKKARTP